MLISVSVHCNTILSIVYSNFFVFVLISTTKEFADQSFQLFPKLFLIQYFKI